MILTAIIRELQDKLLKNDINVSIGKILSLKPFFILYATEKEMALRLWCFCKLCFNAKMMCDALKNKSKKEGDTMPASISFSWAPANAPNLKIGIMIGILFPLNVQNVHLCKQLHYLYKVQKIRYLTINLKLLKSCMLKLTIITMR